MLIATITWPADNDRGPETYGPFESNNDRDEWVRDCQEAESLGYPLLKGAHYLLTEMPKPFDPRDLF